jgi:succinate dehydrogenase / fumarate reductase cytochrome b subunit
MRWLTQFLTSSIGQKLIMSLTGLFLVLFLVVHLAGNLQLLVNDNGEAFNVYTRFMITNPVIKTISYLLYFFILLHTWQGILLWRINSKSRGPKNYQVKKTRAVNTSALLSSRMGNLGMIILIFLIIHLYQFWLQMKLGNLVEVSYVGLEEPVMDLYAQVALVYQNIGFVIFYVIAMAAVGLHLWHGFQSSFQTLGINHRKYSPLIHWVGKAYAIIIPALFALIPIWMFLKS